MHETDDDLIELLLIPRVGRAKAKILYSAGYRTCEDLAKADPEALADLPGISPDLARSIVDYAFHSASIGTADMLETKKELLICPMCGSMVSGSTNICSGCGITFSDEVEDLEVPEGEEKPAGEADGHWYKEQETLFICPECGSLVSASSDSCPKCGIVFEGEEEPAEPVEGGAPPAEADGYWYKGDSKLFMCPNCGAFIKEDANSCASCGIVLEADDGEPEPAGPTPCPTCGKPIPPGIDICKECGFDLSLDRERDGFWYKDKTEIFLCPGCGAFLPKDANACANCGIVLEGEEEEEERVAPQTEALTCPMCGKVLPVGAKECAECGFDFSAAEKDGFWYKEEPTSIFICPGCGAFISETAEKCTNCGATFNEDGDVIGPGEAADDRALLEQALLEQVDELIGLAVPADDSSDVAPSGEAADDLMDLVLTEGGPEEPLATEQSSAPEEPSAGEKAPAPEPPESLCLCPVCGAFIQANILKCPSCNTVFDDIGDIELEPVDLQPGGGAEELARQISADIREIEEELLPPVEAGEELLPPEGDKKPDRKGGVSKDFLDRWKKLDSGAQSKKGAREKAAPRQAPANEDAELELELEKMLVPEYLADETPLTDAQLVGMARDMAAGGLVEDAIACLERAAELNPDRETEYKRMMLEIMGVGYRDEGADISDIIEIDDIGELSIDDSLASETDIARLEEIEGELLIKKDNGALWQEKGDILERLGRHEEAVACFDKSISLSYAELRKDSKEGLSRRAGLQPGIGLTNGQGRVNGRVNGLLTQRGLLNGSAAGLTNGKVNGTGRTNGKGRVNGLLNGRVNGRINGVTNGKGRVNGLVNGLTNGRVNGRTNGFTNGRTNGLTNGMTIGLINGGLVNGLGLVNGEGMVDGSGSLLRLRHRRRDRIMWRYKLTAMVMFVTIVLMLSMLGNLVVYDEGGRINIDGAFADWNDVRGYYNFMPERPATPDLRILETRMLWEGGRLDIFVMLEGDAFAGFGGPGAVNSVWALIDIDPLLDTGYETEGMGVDLMMEMYGWNGTLKGSNLLRFDGLADRRDWAGFHGIGMGLCAADGQRLEAGITMPRDLVARVGDPLVKVMTLDSDGYSDIISYMMTSGPGGMVADFEQGGGDVLLPGAAGVELGHLTLSSHSGGGAVFNSVNFKVTGNGDAADISNLRFMDERGYAVPTTVAVLNGTDFDMALTEPVGLGLNETLTYTLEADVSDTAAGKVLGIELVNASGTVGAPVVRNSGSTLHNIGRPAGLVIDGAFGDWQPVSEIPDPADDVTRTANSTFLNGNADIAGTGFAVSQDGLSRDSLFFRLSVNGIMMGGEALPTVRYRPGPAVIPSEFSDSDKDSVPDNLDAYFQDFDNDGVPDSEAFTTGNIPDVDGDGVGDYPTGADRWLNTTIPADFPVPYALSNVSIYIGPIDSKQTENLGDDRAYIMMDSDDDAGTGINLKGGYGIDWLVVVSGKNNRIIAAELYRNEPASETGWEFAGNVTAAVDWTRMEGSVPLSSIGVTAGQYFTGFVSTEDWRGNGDSMDYPVSSDFMTAPPLTGTRSPAGNNVVINEIVAQSNTGEWMELCNPTNAPINIGGWRLRIANKDLVVFPANTILGAFGSGTEYYIATFYGSANEVPNTGATVLLQFAGTWATLDSVTFPALAIDQSWARYKNATWGMPTDTDNSADFYLSTTPTFRAPNERTAPTIVVDKTGDRIYAATGDQITYTIWYNNTGDGNARHVWVNDTLPAGTTYVSSSVSYASSAGQVYRWYFTNVAPGAHSFTITVSVNAGVPAGTILTNSVQLQYTDQLSRSMGTSADSWAVTVQVPSPLISLTKTASNPTPVPGETIGFTIDYSNIGTGTASYVWLNDTLPAGMTYISGIPAPASVSGQNVFWYFQNVAPGTYQVTLNVLVGAAVAPGTVLTNTVTCDYKNTGGLSLPRVSAQASVTVASPASLIVINEIASRPNPEWVELCNPTGSPVNIGGWRIYATNNIRYTFPAGTVIGAWGSGSEYLVATMTQNNRFSDGGELVRLTTGTGAEIDRTTYPATVNGQTWSRFKHEDSGKPIDTGSDANDFYISNNAWLVPEGPTPAAPNDRKRPIMDVDKTVSPLTAEPGDLVTYTIWYNNTGDGNAKDVWVNDTLPAGVDFVSSNPVPTGVSGQDLVWYFGNVVHDTVNSISVSARVNDVPADGDVVTNNVGLVYRDALRRPMGSSAAQASFTCVRPQITVEKVADVAETVAGGTIVYTIYYNNTGSRSAGSVWINDTLPAGVTFVSSTPALDSISGLTLYWHITNVAPGSHSITVTVTVNATTGGGTIVNWAFLNYSASGGYGLESSSDSAAVVIPEMRNLGIPILGMFLIIIIFNNKRQGYKGKKGSG